jgi:hypothetical protein
MDDFDALSYILELAGLAAMKCPNSGRRERDRKQAL